MPETGKTYTVTLHVEGLKTDADVTYNWSVSNGEILFGQGTRSLEIHRSGKDVDRDCFIGRNRS